MPSVGCPRSLPRPGMSGEQWTATPAVEVLPPPTGAELRNEVSAVMAAYGQVTTGYWLGVVIGVVLLLLLVVSAVASRRRARRDTGFGGRS